MDSRTTLEFVRDLVNPCNQWVRVPRCSVVTKDRTFLYDTPGSFPVRAYPLWTAEQRARADEEIFGVNKDEDGEKESPSLEHYDKHRVAILVHRQDMQIWWLCLGFHLTKSETSTIERGMYYHYGITPEEYRRKHGIRKKDMQRALLAREEEARRQFEAMRAATPEEHAKKVQAEGMALVREISNENRDNEYLFNWARWAEKPENFSVFDELRYDE